MKLPGSEHSKYDVCTDGASTEFLTRLLPRNEIIGSVFFKDNTRRSMDEFPGVAP